MLFKQTKDQKLKKIIHWVREQKVNVPVIPKEFEKITRLDLGLKGLSKLPKEIDCLDNIEELNLSYNKLKALPKEFESLTNLRILNLGYNNLSEFPKQILSMSKLEFLNLEANHIKKIPPEIAKFKELCNLNLFANQIAELPEEFCSLSKLTRLNLALNLLPKLPKSFEYLTSLNEIELWLNKFELIPDVISKLPNLTDMYASFDTEKMNKALVMAVFADNITLAEKLIFYGADVNYEFEGFGSQLFTTPLFEVKSVEMTKLLISKGADINHQREIVKHVISRTGEEEIRNSGKYETFLTINHNEKIAKFLKSQNLIPQ
jgi:Leucine-rich repeat (LRR) protein